MPIIMDRPNIMIGQVIQGYTFLEFIGKGANGVVYKAERKDINDFVAVKIVPIEHLYKNWEIELKKAVKLSGISQFVQYRHHFTDMIDNVPHVFIIWEYVNGANLQVYSRIHPKEITIAFIKNLISEVLKAFFAMEDVKVSHGDLHEGNILIAKDSRVPDELPRIRITDFGIGYKTSSWDASDDYRQLAIICQRLLANNIDPAELTPDDKYVYEKITQEFLRKLVEKDPTTALYERNPKKLIDYLYSLKRVPLPTPLTLVDPFDYLSCEQIGDSFELLQTLYSQNFLGNQDLTQRTNTILTGPRGCGKTTIFRNLSLKTKVLAGTFDPDKLRKLYWNILSMQRSLLRISVFEQRSHR